MDYVNRTTAEITFAVENKELCNTVFLDVTQVIEKVWHNGLLTELSLPAIYFKLIKTLSWNRQNQIKIVNSLSSLHLIKAWVPQRNVLGPISYLILTSDIPQSDKITITTYTDETAIIVWNLDANIATEMLQRYLDRAQEWFKTGGFR